MSYSNHICIVCRENKDVTDMIQCKSREPHMYCKNCVKRHISICISENRNGLKCMLGCCDGVYSIDMVSTFISSKEMDNLKDIIEINEIIDIGKCVDNYQICPKCKKFGCIVDGIQNVKCGRCDIEWCTKCKQCHKANQKCWKIYDIGDKDKIRDIINNIMTEAITNKCAFCDAKYVKETGGCNLIICSQCGTKTCHVCGIKIVSKNGRDYWHFKGSGSECIESTCQLYNDIDGKSDDKGDIKYNDNKIKAKVKMILKENTKDVNKVIISELKTFGIHIHDNEKKSCIIL